MPVLDDEPATALSKAKLVALGLALLCLTVLAYLPAGGNQFVDFDDGAYVTQNPIVQRGLTQEGLTWAFTETHSSNWHPLTWLSHMLDCELFGLDPRGHHLMGVGLHGLAAALCFWALYALTKNTWLSFLAALLFAWHPQRVESVAWVSERKDVLSGVFFFLCLGCYACYARRGSWLAYGAVCLSLALGLLAKQMLVSLPCLLLVLDGWPLGRFRSHGIKRALLEKLPLFALVIAAGLMTLYAQNKGGALSSLEDLPLDARVSNALWASVAYIGKMLWPTDLAFFYPHPYVIQGASYQPWSATVLLSLALLLAVSVGVVLLRKRLPMLLSGWFWYLGLLAPVVGLVHVGTQSMADRYAYLPTLGLYIAILWGAAELLKQSAFKRPAYALGLLACAALLLPMRAQIATWHDSPALFENAIRVTEDNYIAQSNYGFYLQRRGRLEEAEQHYLAAIEANPKLVDAHSNLGAIQIDQKRWPEARAELAEALRLNPRFLEALMLSGLLEHTTHNPQAAHDAYARAMQVQPGYLLARVKRAQMLGELGRASEGLELLQSALAQGARSAQLFLVLGELGWQAGDLAAARQDFSIGLESYPGDEELRLAAAYFFASAKGLGAADRQKAVTLVATLGKRRGWTGLRARAAARAAAGDFSGARSLVLDAMVAAPKDQRASLKSAYEAYQAQNLWLH